MGGESRRMGRDKATIVVDGITLAERCVRALHDAGCESIWALGASLATAVPPPAIARPDPEPGSGPFAAIAGMMSSVEPTDMMVVPCDLPWLDAAAIMAFLSSAAQRRGDVVVARISGRLQPTIGLWRAGMALPSQPWTNMSMSAGISELIVGAVDVDHRFVDADTPDDLPSSQEHPAG